MDILCPTAPCSAIKLGGRLVWGDCCSGSSQLVTTNCLHLQPFLVLISVTFLTIFFFFSIITVFISTHEVFTFTLSILSPIPPGVGAGRVSKWQRIYRYKYNTIEKLCLSIYKIFPKSKYQEQSNQKGDIQEGTAEQR